MTVKIHGYTRDDLMEMDVDSLRAALHERTHHTIEIQLYRILKEKISGRIYFTDEERRSLMRMSSARETAGRCRAILRPFGLASEGAI